jgi:hypothetical protein
LLTLDHTGDLVFRTRSASHGRLQKIVVEDRQARRSAGCIAPHVLRYSFASLAGDLGYSEATVATLIAHKGHFAAVTVRNIGSGPGRNPTFRPKWSGDLA